MRPPISSLNITVNTSYDVTCLSICSNLVDLPASARVKDFKYLWLLGCRRQGPLGQMPSSSIWIQPGPSTSGSKRIFEGRSSPASSQVAVSLAPCLVNVLGVHESLWVTLPETSNRSRFCSAAEGAVPGVPAFSQSLDNQHAPRGSTGSKSGCDGRLMRAQKALLRRQEGELSPRISAHARRESHPEAAVGILKWSDFRTISRHERRRARYAAQSDAHRRHQFS